MRGERTIYDNRWVRLSRVDVEPPDGQRFEHHVVTMPSAAMTVLIDETGERVLLLWRHRFASDVWNWELPGGVVDNGEDPAVAAAREVEEETGYRPSALQHLVTFEPMIGTVRSPHHVYLARVAVRVGEPMERTEMQRMEWMPLADVRRARPHRSRKDSQLRNTRGPAARPGRSQRRHARRITYSIASCLGLVTSPGSRSEKSRSPGH